ncbi:MAG: FAD-dependent oxidoreductase, partial [Candidatus Thermoplasmatota archaeon]
ALMVGSGNVGLIVSYQMIQAGINVKAVVEAMPKIGGYFVHAAKLRRLGVPILTSHTIKEVSGNGNVECATIVKLDSQWNPIAGTEREISVDLVCIAVGLTPSSELLFQGGCKNVYIPELGGWIAWHDRNLETSVKGIYVAGDVSGIEEASTAMIEGKIAGLHAGMKIAKTDKFKGELQKAMKELENLRQGPFGEKPRKGKEKLWVSK